MEAAGLRLELLRPRDSEALLDEEAFEHEEYLPYWAELWPSGVALADALGERDVAGLRVVELGCGLAVPSIAAAARGARVLATDWSPDAVALARRNARRNGVSIEAAVSSWTAPERLVREAPWDLVLAADILYERRNVDVLLDLLPRLVDRGGTVLLADPARPPTIGFLARALDRWTIESVAARPPRVTVYELRLREDGPS